MFDWDDLRIFLAAARSGSLGEAGRKTGVDAVTVSRRIVRLETALKSTLLVRSRAGLQLTAAGAQLLEAASEAETAMERVRWKASRDLVSGTVRISTAEGFGAVVLAPALPCLAAQRPDLRVELAAASGFLSPSRREVDMAITLSAPDARRLVVEPLTNYQLALYAAPDYLQRRGEPAAISDLSQHQIIGYVQDLIYASELRYLEEISPGLAPTLASSSIQAQREMIRAGGGVGVLPCFMAEDLTRIIPQVLLQRRFWLSTHADVHNTARLRAIQQWLRDLVRARQHLLTPFPG